MESIAIVSAVAAIVGALVAWMSYSHAREIFIIAPKRDVIRRLLGNLHVLNHAKLDPKLGLGEPFIALNEATVVFSDECSVTDLLIDLKRNKCKSERVVPLVRQMAKVIGEDLDDFDDDYLLTPFGPPTKNPSS